MLLVGMQIDIATMENSMQVPPSRKINIEIPYDPVIPLLGICPEKTITQKDTCTPMFTAALFSIARTWKQPKGPSTDEYIKKLWYTYTMEYYLAIKRNEIGSSVETWMDIESVTQSEVNQKKENKYCIVTHIWNLEKWYDEPIYREG